MQDSLRGRGPFRGIWSATALPIVVEFARSTTPDFVCFDAQHGDAEVRLTTTAFTALAEFGVGGLVRVARNETDTIGHMLDLGADGVMVPMVNNGADAAQAVAATRYAPSGIRSFGMRTPRIDTLSNRYRPLVAVQIETVEAIDNIDAIAATDGVDWLYVGPADLGLSMGGVPAPDVASIFANSHPLASELLDAFESVVAAAEANDVLPGLHCGSGESTRLAEAHGFRVAAVAADTVEMMTGMANQLGVARG